MRRKLRRFLYLENCVFLTFSSWDWNFRIYFLNEAPWSWKIVIWCDFYGEGIWYFRGFGELDLKFENSTLLKTLLGIIVDKCLLYAWENLYWVGIRNWKKYMKKWSYDNYVFIIRNVNFFLMELIPDRDKSVKFKLPLKT